MEIKLYMRENCMLCDDALEVLVQLQADYSFTIKEEDIAASDELTEKYGLMIPVIEIAGEIVEYGMIDFMAIRDRLEKSKQ